MTVSAWIISYKNMKSNILQKTHNVKMDKNRRIRTNIKKKSSSVCLFSGRQILDACVFQKFQ